jgi:hypothetical protein
MISENTTQTPAEENTAAYESYIGTYYRDGESDSTIENNGGIYIEIESISGNNIKFTITSVSSAPSNRIAAVTADGVIGSNGIVDYIYTDDGWGNAGSGAIVLSDGKIFGTNNVKNRDSSAMWSLQDYNNEIFIK